MEAPSEDDCCHSDCKNCILDIYQSQLSGKTAKRQNQINRILSQTRYAAFKLVRIEENTPSAKVFTFEPENPESEETFFFKPGEHLVLRNVPGSQESEHLSRPYTAIPWDPECRTFSAVIKLYPEGKMSRHIAKWRIGDLTYWRGPYRDFNYEPNRFKHLVMVCMGTGVAPMYALSKHITDDENDETNIHMLYGSCTPEEIILRREIAGLAGFWNFRCTHFLSRGFHEGQKKFVEQFVTGRIRKEDVDAVLEPLDTTRVLGLGCGTDEFNADVSAVLKAKGLSNEQIHVFE